MYSTLCNLFPGATTQELLIDVDPGWTRFNPSIAFSPVEGYKCIIRSSNYTMNELGQYLTNDPHNIIRTKNYLATMDSSLDIVDCQPIKPCKWGKIEYTLVRGLEDARLYWAKDHWQVYGNLREHRRDGLPTIVTARLDHDKLVDPEVYENWNLCQKNHMIMGSGPAFIYKCNPAAIVENNLYWEIGADLPEITREFRGSSQALQIGDGFTAVTHEVDWTSGHRRYFHRFCVFNREGVIVGFTDPFFMVFEEMLFDVPMIEYAAGLVVHGKDFVISFGFKDSRAFLARVPIVEVCQRIVRF